MFCDCKIAIWWTMITSTFSRHELYAVRPRKEEPYVEKMALNYQSQPSH